jgi:hypothetical protein
LRPPITGPWRASPVHISLGRDASNRPNTGGGLPSGRVVSSSRAKWRCRVRSDGDHPLLVRRTRATWAAVRSGFSRFSAAARASTSAGVRGVTWRDGGAKASNPPDRQARIQRSRLGRDTVTGSPNGPACSRAASSRTSRPRWRVLSPGSAASRISAYRNSATARARPARRASSSPAVVMGNLQNKAKGIDLAPGNPAGPPARRLARTGVDQLRRPRRRQQMTRAHRAGQLTRRQADQLPGPATAGRSRSRGDRRHRVRGGSGSRAHSHIVNTPRTNSAREVNRASQPRTVEAGQPSPAAIFR